MDSFAVSVSHGWQDRRAGRWDRWRVALLFAFCQALLFLIGHWIGAHYRSEVMAFDHWVAFVLLGFGGGKAIRDALRQRQLITTVKPRIWQHLPQALATSIDALVVGISLSVTSNGVLLPAVYIGATTLALALIGIYVGRRVKIFKPRTAQIVGGALLIGLGIKILIEHLIDHG